MANNQFSGAEHADIYRVIFERRENRYFLPTAIAYGTIARLLDAAHQNSSVGIIQPWR